MIVPCLDEGSTPSSSTMIGLKMILFSATFALLLTNLYGWLLKRYYVPAPFKEQFEKLFPAHKMVATFYLLHLYEIPYLFNIGDPAALFYVNGTAVMFFSSFTYVMVKGYFFLDLFSPKRMLVFMLPVVICWLVLLLPVVGVIEFSDTFKIVMFCVVSVVSVSYIFFLVHFRNRIHRVISRIEEDEYSNESDFSLKFAKRIEWLPLSVCALMYACFVIDHPVAKLVRDIICIVANVWFVFYTLNPHRTVRPEVAKAVDKEMVAEDENKPVKWHLSEKKCKEIEGKMMDMLNTEKLYLSDHFTMSELAHQMGVNRSYVGEVISRGSYESFYRLINTLRVEHACQMLSDDSHGKMEQIALESGFSSGSAFSQVFKKIKGITPREYIENKNSFSE